jgi:hypothetical protein
MGGLMDSNTDIEEILTNLTVVRFCEDVSKKLVEYDEPGDDYT